MSIAPTAATEDAVVVTYAVVFCRRTGSTTYNHSSHSCVEIRTTVIESKLLRLSRSPLEGADHCRPNGDDGAWR